MMQARNMNFQYSAGINCGLWSDRPNGVVVNLVAAVVNGLSTVFGRLCHLLHPGSGFCI